MSTKRFSKMSEAEKKSVINANRVEGVKLDKNGYVVRLADAIANELVSEVSATIRSAVFTGISDSGNQKVRVRCSESNKFWNVNEAKLDDRYTVEIASLSKFLTRVGVRVKGLNDILLDIEESDMSSFLVDLEDIEVTISQYLNNGKIVTEIRPKRDKEVRDEIIESLKVYSEGIEFDLM
jgi:hypothetical protein